MLAPGVVRTAITRRNRKGAKGAKNLRVAQQHICRDARRGTARRAPTTGREIPEPLLHKPRQGLQNLAEGDA